ncbi:MAG: transglutaminase-like domain-containing protein [Lachnospiraceae bacterium]|nr:transglutaminase-like domain-containing protein [Lachnospiraceae bacterium]
MKKSFYLGLFLMIMCVSGGCGEDNSSKEFGNLSDSGADSVPLTSSSSTWPSDAGLSGHETEQSEDKYPGKDIRIMIPESPNTLVFENDKAVIDYSNSGEGYFTAKYSGSSPKVKLRLETPGGLTYTYDLFKEEFDTFPLTDGDGNYTVNVYENIKGNDYISCLFGSFEVKLKDEFGPALFPNQFVSFDEKSASVQKSNELSSSCTGELEIVSVIYDYVTKNIKYDYELASSPPTGYLPEPDKTLSTGKGICLDYASLMAAMLRCHMIPTRLEVGYANDAYHAWISVYTAEKGWINGIIEFDGNSWSLVDPTFGANMDSSKLKKFIGDGSNYTVSKIF